LSLADEVRALRSSAGISRARHVTLALVEDVDALDLLQAVSTHSPYIREGRVRQTLFLRDDGSIFADVFVVRIQDRFLVLAEGPSERELVDWLQAARERSPKTKRATIRGIGETWSAVGVDGPYSWEVVAGVLGPVVLGLPYLALLHRDGVLCLRAGKTGEYGYLLVAPRGLAAEVESKLNEIGRPLDLTSVSLEALDVCAQESWYFSMRTLHETALASPLTPIELQLQSRLEYSREFVGAEAVRDRRTAGATVRATCFLSDAPVRVGQKVRLEELEVGEVFAACASPTLGQTVGSVLLQRRFAHPHLTLTTTGPEENASLRTCTASLVDGLSMRIQPHKHAYATRDQVEGPSA
jgi:glycine cleavage system aminomethyltransferase T